MSGALTPKGVARLLEWAAGEVFIEDKQYTWLRNIAEVLREAEMSAEVEVVMNRIVSRRVDFSDDLVDELDEILSKEGVK